MSDAEPVAIKLTPLELCQLIEEYVGKHNFDAMNFILDVGELDLDKTEFERLLNRAKADNLIVDMPNTARNAAIEQKNKFLQELDDLRRRYQTDDLSRIHMQDEDRTRVNFLQEAIRDFDRSLATDFPHEWYGLTSKYFRKTEPKTVTRQIRIGTKEEDIRSGLVQEFLRADISDLVANVKGWIFNIQNPDTAQSVLRASWTRLQKALDICGNDFAKYDPLFHAYMQSIVAHQKLVKAPNSKHHIDVRKIQWNIVLAG